MPTRDEGAPDMPVFGEETRRLGSEPHQTDESPVPQTIDLPNEDHAERDARARLRAGRPLPHHARAPQAGGRPPRPPSRRCARASAPPPGIAEVIEPARPLFERTFEAFVGSMDQVPILAISEGVLATQGLDHRAGFLLSCIDGLMTIEHLLDIAGMPRFEALRILSSLLRSKAESASCDSGGASPEVDLAHLDDPAGRGRDVQSQVARPHRLEECGFHAHVRRPSAIRALARASA